MPRFFLTNLDEALKVRKECRKSNIILLNGLINLKQSEIKKSFKTKLLLQSILWMN